MTRETKIEGQLGSGHVRPILQSLSIQCCDLSQLECRQYNDGPFKVAVSRGQTKTSITSRPGDELPGLFGPLSRVLTGSYPQLCSCASGSCRLATAAGYFKPCVGIPRFQMARVHIESDASAARQYVCSSCLYFFLHKL